MAVVVEAEGLAYSLHPHCDLFPEGTLDPEWLHSLGRDRDWIVVSGDIAISHKRTPERLVWEQTGLTAFFLGRGFTQKNRWKQLEQLAQWWPGVIRVAKECEEGSGWRMRLKADDPEPLYYPATRR